MDFLKGIGTPIFLCNRNGCDLHLVSFADESWGIRRDGRMVGTWETDELVDCVRTFLSMAGPREGQSFGHLLAALRPRFPISHKAAAVGAGIN